MTAPSDVDLLVRDMQALARTHRSSFVPVRDFHPDRQKDIADARKRRNAKRYLSKQGIDARSIGGLPTELFVLMCRGVRK